jgi:dihydroorotase/N-acyl-D-amino-acid deacylase
MAFKSLGGVTTCVVGNCGMGAAPHDAAIQQARSFHPGATFPDYEGFCGYLALLDRQPPGVNIAALAGHGTIRLAVMGTDPAAPSREQMARMKSSLAEAVEAGVIGMSTGLIYEPSRHATTEELIELTSELAGTGCLYATHMRDEGVGLPDSVAEALRIGREADVPVQISHHKASGRRAWGLVERSLAMIDEARAGGQVVHADQYPYTAGSTVLSATLGWLTDDSGVEASDLVIASCPARSDWEGRSIADIAGELAVTPASAAAAVLIAEQHTTVVIHSMTEDDVRRVMAHPSTMIGSDGIPTLGAKPHPRLSNTFARVLGHYARELGTFGLAEAVHRMTGMSADAFGLVDRGHLRVGAFADLVLFDPAAIVDRGTFAEPLRTPAGIDEVVVNGTVVVADGAHTGALPGRTLRRR